MARHLARPIATANGVAFSSASVRRSPGAMAELSRLSKEAMPDVLGGQAAADVARTATALAVQLSTEWSAFRSADVLQIVGVFGRLVHRHPPLLEAVAAHVMRGMVAYPLFALCNIVNAFARLGHHHQALFDAVAAHIANQDHASELSPTDIACLVFAFAEFRHRAGLLLELCTRQLSQCYLEVPGPNCAIILNSYARLSECDPKLFNSLSRAVMQTRPESFDVHHISLIMNAFARCSIRKSNMMHLIAGYLDGRVSLLSPQNVANVVHAWAKLDCYNHNLFFALQERVLREDLGAYKLYELANVVHGFAKLRCGGRKLYQAMFTECQRRCVGWEPRTVAQVLDAMRRRRTFYSETLALLLMRLFLENMRAYAVHPLTQTAWCLVELDSLDLAARMLPDLVPASEDGGLMRLVLERMEELSRKEPLTTTQRCYVQQLVRAYHYKYELDYGLQPQHVRTFCRLLFDVPSSVITSVGRTIPR